MEYQYKIKTVTLSNGLKALTIDLPESMGAVADFLTSDISSELDGLRINELIDSVLDGMCEYEEARGNACRIEINKEYTRVVNYLFEQLEDEKDVEYSIKTTELRKLVQEWAIEIEKFRKQVN